MTPIYVQFDKDPGGTAIALKVFSSVPLHIAQYIEIMDVWLSVFKKQHAFELKEYEDLKKSGKVVSMAQWKKQT